MRSMSFIVALVFMFNSSALFAKSVQMEFDGQEMVEKLERELKKEQARAKKTELAKAERVYKKAMNKAFDTVEKKVVKHYKLSQRGREKRADRIYKKYLQGMIPRNMTLAKSEKDLLVVLEDLKEMRDYNLYILERQFKSAHDYVDFLTVLIDDLKLNLDENGYLLSNSRASIDSVPMTLIGAIVLGVAQVAFIGLFVALVVFAVIGIVRLIRTA